MQIITFGCRLNTFESTVIEKFLKKYNLHDVIVINTCAVTKEAERQALQKVRSIKARFPNFRLLITGCSAELNKENFLAENVDFIIPNKLKMREEIYSQLAANRLNLLDYSTENSLSLNSFPIVESDSKNIRAFVPIQTGCNYGCSFCCVSKIRGPSVSFLISNILEQITKFAPLFPVVILTGINISTFGLDLMNKSSLPDLIKTILKEIPNLQFLGLSSLDPFLMNSDLINLYASEPKLLPHCHLSIQSGDNRILKLMKRRHTREKVIDVCLKIKKISNRNISIGADIITGFPSERDEEFFNTLNLIQEADLDFLHIFPFSPRPHTEASLMSNQIQKPIAKERAKKLRVTIDLKFKETLKQYIGKTIPFFRENCFTGRSINYIEIKSTNKLPSVNGLLYGKVIGIQDNKLLIQC